MERRKLLAVLGGSASIGLAGCTGDDDNGGEEEADNNSSDGGKANHNGGDGEKNENNSSDAESEFLLTNITNTTVLIGNERDLWAVVKNDDEKGTQPVNLKVGNESREQEVSLDGSEERLVLFKDIDTGSLGAGDDDGDRWTGYNVTITTADDKITGWLRVWEELDDDQFLARSTGGWAWFGEPNEEAARADALELPPERESSKAADPVVLIGEYDEAAGAWESIEVDFPMLEDRLPSDSGIEVEVVDGLTGELNVEAESLTASGSLKFSIVGFEGEAEDLSFTFPLHATTEGSGELEGDFEVRNSEGTITLVDNQTTVRDRFFSAVCDSFINPLPGSRGSSCTAEPGNNWFELTMDVEELPAYPDTAPPDRGEPGANAVRDSETKPGEDGEETGEETQKSKNRGVHNSVHR